MEDMMTPQQAAQELGITSRAVRDAIKRGSLPATRLSERVLLITREDVERYRRERLGVSGLKRWWQQRKEQGGNDDEALRAETESTMCHIADAANHVAQSQQALQQARQRLGQDGDDAGE
jgi:excisionase family DNA binding protein